GKALPEAVRARCGGGSAGCGPADWISVDARLLEGGRRRGLGALATASGAGCSAAAEVADGPAEALEGVPNLAGHDPELVGVPFGDLRQHLQVLVGEQFLVRIAGVDGLEDGSDGLCLTLGAQGGGP